MGQYSITDFGDPPSWDDLPTVFKSPLTFVYLSCPDANGHRKLWNLYGIGKGKQGTTLLPGKSGFVGYPFQMLLTEGPYVEGAIFEGARTLKRETTWSVDLHARDEHAFFDVWSAWTRSFSPKADGYFGALTPQGWFWLKTRLSEAGKYQLDQDPTAFKNNAVQIPMNTLHLDPYYYTETLSDSWTNGSEANTPLDVIVQMLEDYLPIIPGVHVGEGSVVLTNTGDVDAWPRFMVSGPGKAWIRDGMTDRMVPLPLITPAHGDWALVDTDPAQRTLTAQKDPVDPWFFQIARNSQLVDVLLHDIASSTLPLWKNAPETNFLSPIPPGATATIKVRHSHHGATITGYLPQKHGSYLR